jgi:UDP:flavonoid glycosyltransferase YjiC (YdhE family)
VTAPRRILLVTVGSLGDLHPYLALGRELQRRGHAPVVATLTGYGARVRAAGLEFHPVRPDIDVEDPEELRRAMDPRTGSRYVVHDMALGRLRESFDDLRAATRDADLVVGHPIAYGALLLARASRRPWVAVALSPLSLFSALDPPAFPGPPVLSAALAALPPFAQRALIALFDRATRSWLRPYRELERELGLAPGPNPIFRGQHSPHLNLGLFSPHFARPQADWPANTVATGFPFYAHDDESMPEIERFLDAGEPPVVFTLGSAAVGLAGDFYKHSVLAVVRMGLRALLLVGRDPANRPRFAVPDSILAVPYAPHAAVFARAAAIVHQCGIGTTGEALRAGKPMLAVPYSHDQPDHARRLCRLGVARSLPRARYDAVTAGRELTLLLRDRGYAERAAALGAKVRAEDGVATACDALEKLLA